MKNALLLADPAMQKIGRIDEIQRILERSGIASVVFDKVEPDPTIEEIEELGQLYREHGCDGLIGLGGGSTMDAAKATSVRVTQSGILAEYDAGVGGAAKIKAPLPPIICIPTTSGTGSETNSAAMITDKQRNVKFAIISDLIQAKSAIIDPVLCKTMPPAITASTGIDALAHCCEAYVEENTAYHPYYEALALYGVKLVGRSLIRAFNNGEDIHARTDMCMAAAFGGLAINKGLGLGHAISHVLGAHYHIPHGRACAMGLLCFVQAGKETYKKQSPHLRSPFSDLAWALDQSQDLEAALVKLFTDLNMPLRLRDIGIPEEDLKKIAFETTKDVANLVSNPGTLSEHQILELLKEFY